MTSFICLLLDRRSRCVAQAGLELVMLFTWSHNRCESSPVSARPASGKLVNASPNLSHLACRGVGRRVAGKVGGWWWESRGMLGSLLYRLQWAADKARLGHGLEERATGRRWEESNLLQQLTSRGLCSFFSPPCAIRGPRRHDSLNGETVKPLQKDGFVSMLFFYGRALVILIN